MVADIKVRPGISFFQVPLVTALVRTQLKVHRKCKMSWVWELTKVSSGPGSSGIGVLSCQRPYLSSASWQLHDLVILRVLLRRWWLWHLCLLCANIKGWPNKSHYESTCPLQGLTELVFVSTCSLFHLSWCFSVLVHEAWWFIKGWPN